MPVFFCRIRGWEGYFIGKYTERTPILRNRFKLSLAVFDMLCYNKMNYADNTVGWCTIPLMCISPFEV